MMWTIRFVVCFVAVSLCSKLCDGTRLEEFLREKQAYLQEFDSLFDTFYLNSTSHQPLGTNAQRQVLRSQPLPSPDWSTHSTSFDDVTEHDTEDYLDSSLFEDENYRPREEASGMDVRVNDLIENSSRDVFSGDSGLFLTGKPGDDDDEGYEDVGSGDSMAKTTPSRQTTLIFKEATTSSAPVEADNAVDSECTYHLRAEMKSCIEFSFNVRTILHEMENFVVESGYYNESSSYYFMQLFRSCASTIVSPPSCLELDADMNVVDVVNSIATAVFSYRNDDGVNTDHGHFDCFHTHLEFLQFCLRSRLTNEQLETLVRVVIVGAKDASARECQDLNKVQQCVVVSVAKCEDSTSVQLVWEMFEATKRVMVTCAVDTGESRNDAAVKMSWGSGVTIMLSVLGVVLHKQIHI